MQSSFLLETPREAPAARWQRYLRRHSEMLQAILGGAGPISERLIAQALATHAAALMPAPRHADNGEPQLAAARTHARALAQAAVSGRLGSLSAYGFLRPAAAPEMSALGVQIDFRLALLLDQARVGAFVARHLTGVLPGSAFARERQQCLEDAFRNYATARFDLRPLAHTRSRLLEAEQMEKTDYLALHRLGMIHLYTDTLIDLDRAEALFRDAGWFAKVESSHDARRLAELMVGDAKADAKTDDSAALPAGFALKALAAESYCQGSIAAMANGRLSAAVELAQQACELDADAIGPGCQLLRLLARQGSAVDAAKVCYRLLRRHPVVAAVLASDSGLLRLPQIQSVLARCGREFAAATETARQRQQAADRPARPSPATAHLAAPLPEHSAARSTAPAGPQRRASDDSAAQAGQVFRDGPELPEMVVIAAGEFIMGSRAHDAFRGFGEAWVSSAETPAHHVAIARPFALGRYPITFDEFDRFVRDSGYACRPDDLGWGRGKRPAININVADAEAYCRWLAALTGRAYRLPSEAEWEYCARAGSSTEYWWGDSEPTATQANTRYSRCAWSGVSTSPCDFFPANPFGLHDMLGNVEEWCADLWHDSYAGAPIDGSAWTGGGETDSHVTLRGGSWFQSSRNARCASRDGYDASLRHGTHGFRVARDLG